MIFLISNYNLNNNETDVSFEYMYNKYKNTVYAMIGKCVSDRELKRDIMQEIFMKFYKSMGRVQGEVASRRWLFAIAHNTIIDMSKKDSMYKSRVKLINDENEIIPQSECIPENLPLDNVLRKEIVLKVVEIIKTMKPIHKEAINLRYYLEFTPTEIAALCEISVDTVYSRLRRAEEIIQKGIEKYMKEKGIQ